MVDATRMAEDREWLSNHLAVLRQELKTQADAAHEGRDLLVADLFQKASRDVADAERHAAEAFDLASCTPTR